MPVFFRYPALYAHRAMVLSLTLLALSFPLSVSASPLAAPPESVPFDVQALKSHGLDPNLAEWFGQAPRFVPGKSVVALMVNGRAQGKITLLFDDKGQPCFDGTFLKQAGLISPPGFTGKENCFDLKSAWPQTEVRLDPESQKIDIVLPQQAIEIPGSDGVNWGHGGVAGLLNYNAQYMDTKGASQGVSFSQLGTEAGLNAGDWILRSRQTFSRTNGTGSVNFQSAFAQRSFVSSKQVLQVGQVSLSNSMFGAGQVLGFQLFPEAALLAKNNGAGLVDGVASTQSVVEVRQSGALIYSTMVPAGPFHLQGLPLLNTRSDLSVTVTGSNGDSRQFVVPASSFSLNGNSLTPGWSLGAGRLDQQGSSESPVLGTIARGWQPTPTTTVSAGLLGSSPYNAAAVGVDTQLFANTLLSLQTRVAQDEKHGDHGLSFTASVSHGLTESTSINFNATQQTMGYRELSDALQDDEQDRQDNTRTQLGGGISWASDVIGGLSVSLSSSTTFRGDTTHYLSGSWSKQFGKVFTSLTLEHNTGTRITEAENRLYLNLSVPFGQSRISNYINSDNNDTRTGMSYSTRDSQDRGWSLSSEGDITNHQTSAAGSVDMVTPYSQLAGSLSHDSDNTTSWSARASGAVVFHDHGIILSPYNVGDTFGIAKVGNEPHVRLETPSGPTWTDGQGYAVLPSLNGYQHSAVRLDTRSLAKNVDIGNALQETDAARGSVSYVNFDVIRTRRVLVDVTDVQGKPLPHGAAVFDAEGNFVTVVGDKGAVFIPDASPNMSLNVQSSGETLCTITLKLAQKAELTGLYEMAHALCR